MDNNKYHYSVEGVNYDVVIEEIEGNIARVNVNGKSFSVLMTESGTHRAAEARSCQQQARDG